MKELNNIDPLKQGTEQVVPAKDKLIIDISRMPGGMKLYRMAKNFEIEEAPIETNVRMVKFMRGNRVARIDNKTVRTAEIDKEKYLYVIAINPQVADKKFGKLLGVALPKDSKPTAI